jgi:DNA-binding NarL/FixJ family response regulator
MPGSSGGFSFIDLICKNHPKVPLIVLSASENPSHIRKCVGIGAMGFVTKSAPKRSLFSAIDKALSGEIYMPESLIRPMPDLTRIMIEVDQGSEAISGLLTERQLDILARISKGLSNKLIARELNLSENTIKVHVSAILRALGLNNRTQAGLMGQKLASTLASESADNDD